MLRFLLTRRWVSLFVVACAFVVGCALLSHWQFARFGERSSAADTTKANLKMAPVTVGRLMSASAEPPASKEWRPVTATGRYDAAHTVTVLYRTRGGTLGVDVVVPLRQANGPAVLVDRGWVRTRADSDTSANIPRPPGGLVTVRGWLRVDGTGSATTPHQRTVRAISAAAIGPTLPYPMYEGFVQLTHESPRVSPAPAIDPGPSVQGALTFFGAGASLFYAIEWIFFALLGFGFYAVFARAEYLEQKRAAAQPAVPSATGPAPTSPPEASEFGVAQATANSDLYGKARRDG